MQKTKIEWCDYTVNPVKGLCPVACDYCYARRMYKRFKWNPEVRFEDDVLYSGLPLQGKDGDRCFIGSTIELFGEWVKEEWLIDIFEWVKLYPKRTFIFLTKRPKNLFKWSPFPDNCWVGVSATNKQMYWDVTRYLHGIKAKVKFISFEPLLENVMSEWGDHPYYIEGKPELGRMTESQWLTACGISWLIIGQQTPISPKTFPKYIWIEAIVLAADKSRIPVFIKDNLNSCEISDYPNLLDKNGNLRQELPRTGYY